MAINKCVIWLPRHQNKFSKQARHIQQKRVSDVYIYLKESAYTVARIGKVHRRHIVHACNFSINPKWSDSTHLEPTNTSFIFYPLSNVDGNCMFYSCDISSSSNSNNNVSVLVKPCVHSILGSSIFYISSKFIEWMKCIVKKEILLFELMHTGT